MFGADTSVMVGQEQALPGRPDYTFDVPSTNVVLGTSLQGPWDDGVEVLYLGMGCFWGAEEYLWQIPGVVSTAVGYQGGFTPHPTYEEVCTGRTGHTEIAMVAYDPEQTDVREILRVFWEHHDPTQGYRQGNDVGTQYRSAIYWTSPEQQQAVERTREAYQQALSQRGLGQITTQIAPASEHPFYFAEAHHQQYLHKNPHGYRCHANTGVALPG